MKLFRCGSRVPAEKIQPSNWSTTAYGVVDYIYDARDRWLDHGDLIVVIEILDPPKEAVGRYYRVNNGHVSDDLGGAAKGELKPFGLRTLSDKRGGWFSFNREYSGEFQILGTVETGDRPEEEIYEELVAKFGE